MIHNADEWSRNSLNLETGIHSTGFSKYSISYFTYICLGIACLIFCHSAYINKFKFTNIRLFTDLSCLATIVACSFLKIDEYFPSPNNDAFLVDLCVYGIFGTIIQLCDNYMTLSRYLVVYPKTTTKFKLISQIYIYVLLVFAYLPFLTILPCFVNGKSKVVRQSTVISAGYLYTASYLSYNFYFSYYFWKAMRYSNSFSRGNGKMLLLGFKNIIHNIISSIGVIFQGMEFFYPLAPAGCIASFLTVIIALHFLFNWKIENAKFLFKPSVEKRNSGSKLLRMSSSAGLITERRISGGMFHNQIGKLSRIHSAAMLRSDSKESSISNFILLRSIKSVRGLATRQQSSSERQNRIFGRSQSRELSTYHHGSSRLSNNNNNNNNTLRMHDIDGDCSSKRSSNMSTSPSRRASSIRPSLMSYRKPASFISNHNNKSTTSSFTITPTKSTMTLSLSHTLSTSTSNETVKTVRVVPKRTTG